ncbi:unnamed protein product [Ilex paraguariensis]|uniref:Uncharacterized protein n=1 Tax=Ilex paraguariensis TaxID=185542 RepID=A0ABC8UWS0_9AQUA
MNEGEAVRRWWLQVSVEESNLVEVRVDGLKFGIGLIQCNQIQGAVNKNGECDPPITAKQLREMRSTVALAIEMERVRVLTTCSLKARERRFVCELYIYSSHTNQLISLALPVSWFTIFIFFSPFFSTLRLTNAPPNPRQEVITARNGVVATDDGRCSTIGKDVLREGGHAVDASVAATLCLGVVSPASSGLGGGGFILVRSTDGKAQVFDMRETAPMRALPVLASYN